LISRKELHPKKRVNNAINAKLDERGYTMELDSEEGMESRQLSDYQITLVGGVVGLDQS